MTLLFLDVIEMPKNLRFFSDLIVNLSDKVESLKTYS